MKDNRRPNIHECKYKGYKLSCYNTDDIKKSEGYIVIGADGDDEEVCRERVQITVVIEENGDEKYIDIDLEDILRFSADNCKLIYERVFNESNADFANRLSKDKRALKKYDTIEKSWMKEFEFKKRIKNKTWGGKQEGDKWKNDSSAKTFIKTGLKLIRKGFARETALDMLFDLYNAVKNEYKNNNR